MIFSYLGRLIFGGGGQRVTQTGEAKKDRVIIPNISRLVGMSADERIIDLKEPLRVACIDSQYRLICVANDERIVNVKQDERVVEVKE